MRTLLVLGSKPKPTIPSRDCFDAVACANGSGRSAAELGLPDPVYTAVSAVLTSGIASGRHSMQAMRGLHTAVLHMIPRPALSGGPWKRIRRWPRAVRTTAPWFQLRLRAAGYRWDRFETRSRAAWHALVAEQCGGDREVAAQIAAKQPSTGVLAVALGLADPRFERVIVAGMSFELTHAYGVNPEIEERGTAASRHADTDVLVLSRLARGGRLFTSEDTVAERAGVPRWAANASAER